MTDFEIFTVVLSFILGLGIAQILSSVVFLVHSRRSVSLNWIPFFWAAAIFGYHINFLFAVLWFYTADRTFGWYLLDLFAAVLLFLSGGLVLPSESRPLPEALDEFFDRDGRLALLPLAIFLASSIPYNVQAGLSWIGQDNVINYALLVFTSAAFLVSGRIRAVATVGFAVLVAYALLFVFQRPGLG